MSFRLVTKQALLLIPPVTTTALVAIHNNKSITTTTSKCESNTATLNDETNMLPSLQKRMTAIGRFALKSETVDNPSQITFFLALSDNKKTPETKTSTSDGLSIQELNSIWKTKKIFEKHPRFNYCISKDDDRYFNIASKAKASLQVEDYISQSSVHYSVHRNDLRHKIQSWLVSPLDLSSHLWEGIISTGPLGSSGAIPSSTVKHIKNDSAAGDEEKETVILFRAHHSMADGVSLANLITDISDEADQVQAIIQKHLFKIQTKKKQLSFWQKVLRKLYTIINFWCIGSIRALVYHGNLLLSSSLHPFAQIMHNDSKEATSLRSVSWCNAAPVDEVKQIAKILSPGSTINDVFVSCISAAVVQQMKEHQQVIHNKVDDMDLPSAMNVVIPVHLSGGMLPPGQSMGNHIGAMVVRVPAVTPNDNDDNSSTKRLTQVSTSIQKIKSTPSPFISYYMAKLCATVLSNFPNVTSKAMKAANANATVVISNVRGPDFKLHLNGRPVQSLMGFLPIPPGIPIGVVVQSYNGMMSLSVTADSKVVPDADRFLRCVLLEYGKLYKEAIAARDEKTVVKDAKE